MIYSYTMTRELRPCPTVIFDAAKYKGPTGKIVTSLTGDLDMNCVGKTRRAGAGKLTIPARMGCLLRRPVSGRS